MRLFSLRRRGEDRHAADATLASPDVAAFLRGTREVIDLFAPSTVEVERDHLRLDTEYARVLAITSLPTTVGPGWLSDLIVFEEPLTLAIHLRPLDSQRILTLLTRYLTRLQTARRLLLKDERLDDPELEGDFRKARRLQEALQNGSERPFQAAHYILLRGSSPADLDAQTAGVLRVVAGMGAQARVAYREQDAGFTSCLPLGLDGLTRRQNLDTSAVALGFPFTGGTPFGRSGVVVGRAPHTHSLVIVDPFDQRHENYNLTVVAMSGAGKSFFVKVLAARLLPTGVEAIIVDPEAKEEYRPLCQAVGGRYVRLAPGAAEAINPFDLPPPPPPGIDEEERREARDRLAEAATAVAGLVEIMLAERGGALPARERTTLVRAIYATYAAAGIVRDDEASWTRTPPLLGDLHRILVGLADDDLLGPLARDLAFRLEEYLEGPLAPLFARQTSFGLDRRLLVFNIAALDDSQDPRPLALGVHLITRFVWGQIRHSVVPRLLIVDEAWLLLQHEAGGTFLESMARRARKYYLSLVPISTIVGDFLADRHGRVIFNNSALKLVLRQDENALGALRANLPLTERECAELLRAPKGAGYFFARHTHVWVELGASPAEYRMATSDARDLLALERERAAARAAAPAADD